MPRLYFHARVVPIAVALALAPTLLAGDADAVPTWQRATTLAGPGAYANDVAVNSGGDTVAVYVVGQGDLFRIMARSRPAGGNWSAPQSVSGAHTYAGQPQVALDDAGRATAVWTVRVGPRDVIQGAHSDDHGAWSMPADLSDAAASAGAPGLAIDPAGTVTAAWEQLQGNDEVARASTLEPHGTWSTPATLAEPSADISDIRIDTDRDGTVVAVWTRVEGSLRRVQTARKPSGAAWTIPVTLSEPGQNAQHPEVTDDGAGGWLTVWARRDGTNYRVQSSTRLAEGDWATPVTLSDAGADAYRPTVVVDHRGRATVAWLHYENAQFRIKASTRLSGSAWSIPANLSAAGASVQQPVATSGGDGVPVVAWLAQRPAGNTIEAVRRTAGGDWTNPVPLSDPGALESPRLASDSDGDAVAIWATTDTRVQVSALDAAGPVVTSLDVAQTVVSGTPLNMSVEARDDWSGPAEVTWSFGDGGTATGTTTRHAWSEPGKYDVVVTAADTAGNTTTTTTSVTVSAPTPTPTPTPAPTPTPTPTPIPIPIPTPPRVLDVKLAPARILTTGPASRTRTRAAVTLSGPGTMTVSLAKRGSGAKPVVVAVRNLPKGASTLTIRSRANGKVYRPGVYRVIFTTSSGGVAGNAVVRLLRIERPRHG